MLKLEFNKFQEKLKLENQRGYYPTVHCMINPVGFKFIIKSQEKWDYYTEMLFETINTYAELNDINPVAAFDDFVINYCSGTLQIEPEEEETVELVEEPEYTGDEYKKSMEIDAGDELVEDADGYSDFLNKYFNRMEKAVLASIDKLDVKKSFDSEVNKTMGEFLRGLFNGVNTLAFSKQVKKYIKIDLNKGLNSAESETNMDIGFTEAYQDKMNLLASQQIDGYTINGKKWFGIKGVTKEIQAKVIQTVQEGVNENKSLAEIKAAVKEDYSGFSDHRANLISRTETNRIISEGKLIGYKETGIEGGKIAMVAVDNRTSDICKRMAAKYGKNPIPLDDDFIDDVTKKAFIAPPFHVQCRSTISFVAK